MSGLRAPRTETFDPTKISASRLNAYSTCGKAFKMEYIDLMQQQRSGSAALFGTVLHQALEKWATNKQSGLGDHVINSWGAATAETVVFDFLRGYRELSAQAVAFEEKILAARPDIKAVRMTKDWKQSSLCKLIRDYVAGWREEMNEKSPWLFTENDPLPALFDESIRWAKKYEAEYKVFPDAKYVEVGFTFDWHGFNLNGYIDAIEVWPTMIVLFDYKTYRRMPKKLKDSKQLAIYNLAIDSMRKSGELELPDLPLWSCMDYVMLMDRKFYRVNEQKAYDSLLRSCEEYRNGVLNGVFLSADKNRDPDYCPFPDNCCLNNVEYGEFSEGEFPKAG